MNRAICGMLLLSVSLPSFPTLLFSRQAQAQQTSGLAKPPANAPYRNAQLPIDQRVEDLLSRMTTAEKVAQLLSIWNDKPKIQDAKDNFDPTKARALYPHGLGQFARVSDRKGPGSPRELARRDIPNSVAYLNAMQKWAVEQTRLGIPVLAHEEALHGLAARDGTSFPQAIALASTFDPDLIREINSVIGRETRARGIPLVLSPVVDVARDPRWGRIEETFGEDPYLAGELGVAAVEGLQGPKDAAILPKDKVLATLKHMTGHGQPESGTNTGPAPIAERTLREMFFPPFEEVVERTGIGAVMPSYNEIDGVPSHANKWLLTNVLRNEWGFKGAIISDYYAINEMIGRHKIASDDADAARRAIEAGVDADLPSGGSYHLLEQEVAAGRVSMDRIDGAVRHLLTLKFRAGLFEQPYARISDTAVTNNADAVALARKAAEKSLVLLKNNGALPLAFPSSSTEKKPVLAVIGSSAAVARQGGYYGDPRMTISALDGIKAIVGDRFDVRYSEGVRITENDDWWADKVSLPSPDQNKMRIDEAIGVARDADQIILFLGDTEQTSREAWADEHLGDRSSLDLVGEQNALLDAMKALGKPVIVVLVNGRPPAYPNVVEKADAILETWYGGEQQGHAIAGAIFGNVNPGGKLPVTVPRNAGQIPYVYNHKPTARRGYLFDDKSPLFPFGHGLSYTRFTISPPRLSATTISSDGSTTVSVDVTNAGSRDGDEIVQLYVRDVVSSVSRPVKELKAFQRISLAAGATKTVTFTVGPKALRMWNIDMKRVVEPGEFQIMVGPDSVNLQTVTLNVSGDTQ